ncbi:hypothetical protein CEXT_417951 [Caerostris extrusa]|uniref:Uncharacterized protein n=1 Tax=Caerostris extrusa TaxID=172846 RepID=A0AAV4S944_CAEEX|nr:hypothetical protein CEXT_417951 [Caerostris extrusa]
MRSCGTAEVNNGFPLIEKRIEDYYAMVLNLCFGYPRGENRQKTKMIPNLAAAEIAKCISYAWRVQTSWEFYRENMPYKCNNLVKGSSGGMRSCGTAEANNGFSLIEKRIEDYYAMVLKSLFWPPLGRKPPKRQI